jgi:hypothetical protein
MDFFEEHHNALDEDFCKHVIEKFENDETKQPGTTIDGVNPDMKRTIDLCFYGDPNWEEEDKVFYEGLIKYTEPYIKNNYSDKIPGSNVVSYDTGYQIQRTEPGEVGYQWHHDFLSDVNPNGDCVYRIITFLWYLNTTVGGTTQFYDGTHIQPETGKLILFPSTWTFAHMGHPPTEGLKYICTGWIWQNIGQVQVNG